MLEKLEPILPKAVKQWRASLPLLDTESRDLLQKQIAMRASELLGDVRNRILLPPPPADAAKEQLEIGTVRYLDLSYPFGLSRSNLLQHLGIFGRSGSGKTNIVFGLLKRLSEEGIPFLFLDTKRTARHLLPHLRVSANFFTPGRSLSPMAFALLVPPPGLDLRVHISQLVDLLGACFTLGDAAKSVIQRVLIDAYDRHKPWPTIEDVLLLLRSTEAKGRAAGWKASALRAIESLSIGIGLQRGRMGQSELTNRLLSETTILELDGLAENVQQFIVSLLAQWLFYYRLAQPDVEILRLVIIYEESHNFFYRQENRAKESILNRFLRQCREVGIGVVVVDQNPSLISKAALGNTYTTIALNLKEPTDVTRAASMALLRDDQKKYLNMLPIGEGIVKLQGRWQKPFLVRFPKIDIQKGCVTDEMISRNLRDGKIRLRNPPVAQRKQETRQSVSDRNLDERSLLADCLSNMTDGVQKRYKRLGFSVDRGTRIKNSLLDRKLIEASEIQVGRAIRQVVRPTALGLLFLGLSTSSPRESIPHQFWKNYYVREFRSAGYSAETEVHRHGGRVDVLATKGDEKIGIEVETGRSEIVRNVRNCQLSRFTRVVVVATTGEALGDIESRLLAERLLGATNVVLVLRDGFTVSRQQARVS